MKKAIFAVLAVMALAACGGTHAQTIAGSFTSSNNKVFTIDGVRSVEGKAGYIEVVYASGNNSGVEFTDATGSLWTKVKASAPFAASFVQVGTTQRYMQATSARNVICDAGGTNIVWQHGSNENFTGDGCALHAALRARSTLP